jgi:hypothetical protein
MCFSCCGASFIYRLYNSRARTEPSGTSANISLSAENSPSTETLNFLLVRKEVISLIRLVESSNCAGLMAGQSATLCKCILDIQEYRSFRHNVVEI